MLAQLVLILLFLILLAGTSKTFSTTLAESAVMTTSSENSTSSRLGEINHEFWEYVIPPSTLLPTSLLLLEIRNYLRFIHSFFDLHWLTATITILCDHVASKAIPSTIKNGFNVSRNRLATFYEPALDGSASNQQRMRMGGMQHP